MQLLTHAPEHVACMDSVDRHFLDVMLTLGGSAAPDPEALAK